MNCKCADVSGAMARMILYSWAYCAWTLAKYAFVFGDITGCTDEAWDVEGWEYKHTWSPVRALYLIFSQMLIIRFIVTPRTSYGISLFVFTEKSPESAVFSWGSEIFGAVFSQHFRQSWLIANNKLLRGDFRTTIIVVETYMWLLMVAISNIYIGDHF